ncbi:MAG: histidine kinase [Bacteroidetes bacterium]|nr:MAG: histidine kinase [Bacteroidota bacterium]
MHDLKQELFLRRLLLLLFSFTLFPGITIAQNNSSLDSLWKIVYNFKGRDKETLKKKKQQLSDMFGVAMYGDIPEALRVADSLAETCRLLGDSMAYYEAKYRHKANVYESVYDHRKVFENLRKYADAVTRLGGTNGYAYVDIGNQYFSMSLNDMARQYYQKADEIFTKEHDFGGSCTVLDNLGLIWREKKNLDSCMHYYNRSLVLRRDSMKDPYLEAYTYLKIGNALGQFDRKEEELDYMQRCRSIFDRPAFEQYKDFVSLRESHIVCYRILGKMQIDKGNKDSARFFIEKADEMTNRYDAKRQLPLVFAVKASLMLLEKNYPAAWELIQKSEVLMKERGDGWGLLDNYKLKIAYYEQRGDLRNANLIYRQREQLLDSLSLVTNDDQMLLVNNAMLQYDNDSKIEKQNNEILRKNEQVEQQQREKYFLFAIVAAMLLVISGGFYFFFQIRRKNRLIEKYNSELEVANSTKEKFLSLISHDLRNPFNTLIGMSNLLVANARNNDLAQVVSNAEVINESSRKAYVMLDNLMQWVSLQKEKIQVRKEHVDIHVLVDEIMLLFRNQALAQSVTIEKDIRVRTVYTDRNLVQVMLRNLLSNAIRHIPAGGKVILRITCENEQVTIEVEDNGTGLDEETLKTLFGKKSGMGIARKGGGLGLELVQEFVHQLGGTIHAENRQGGGARFIIVLQAAVSGEEKNRAAAGSAYAVFTLSPQEKQILLPLADEMMHYEIFDTTELRNLIDGFPDKDFVAVAEWKRRMLQAVLHTNTGKYESLLKMIRD